MGALVVESVTLAPRGSGTAESVRVSGGLSIQEGRFEHMLPLLEHVFAAGAAPDLSSAVVDFVLDGAAYQWRGDFTLGTAELSNRTTNQALTGQAVIESHLSGALTAASHARAASFSVPDPDVPGPEARQMPGEPPPSAGLANQLAQYEEKLRSLASAHETVSALYSELFPLLEAQEEAASKLELKIRQLEKHRLAEAAMEEFRQVESRIQEQIAAGRQARQVEKQIAEFEAQRDQMVVVDEDVQRHAEELEQNTERAREAYIHSEKAKKHAVARSVTMRPLRWWIASALACPILVAPALWKLPYAEYIWTLGALLAMSFPMAAFVSLRKKSSGRIAQQCALANNERRTELELAELAYTQLLRPFGVRDVQHLREKGQAQQDWYGDFERATEELVYLRKLSGTDDTLKIHSARESAELAELEQKCREFAPYRLSDTDRESVEQMVHELEGEARCQKEAAVEIKRQCEKLAEGWSDLPLMTERVAALRQRLADWQRWEAAFRRIREVIDRLPDIPDLQAPGPEIRAAEYLTRLTAGRWTKLHYDPVASEFKIYDTQSGMWIHADRDNPAVRSTVDLAYRLCLVEDEMNKVRLPVWIIEPFEELPDTMMEATAKLLTEVAQRRQVVLLCRQKPALRWPSGSGIEST
jgi:hypothetical protein